MRCAQHQIVRDFDRTLQFNPGSTSAFELDRQPVLKCDRLKDRSEFVVAVRALIEDSKIEVELGDRRNVYLQHQY